MLLVTRPRAPERPWLRAIVGAVLALVGHGLFVLVFLLLSHLKVDVPRRDAALHSAVNRPVTLRGITAEQWSRNRGQHNVRVKDERASVSKRAPEEKKELKTPEPIPKGQVVDVAPGNGEVDPNSKFIAETNNKAQKESRAKEQTAFYRNAMPQRTAPRATEAAGSDAVEKAQRSGNDGLAQDDRPRKDGSSKAVMEVPDQKAHSEVAMRIEGTGPGAQVKNRNESMAAQGNSTRLKVVPGEANDGDDGSQGRIGRVGVLNLLPSAAVVDKVVGAAANDHLRDVDEGDGTYLSTREWKYASFFNRVKQSVGQHWSPQGELRQRDPTMQIYGGRDRYTLLQVTLTQDGKLKEAYVEKSSGIDFLDVEAIKAFERAQPFPNPPAGLLATDQAVHFQFGFFLEMSGRPGLRLFRAAD